MAKQVCWLSGNVSQRKLLLNAIKKQFSAFQIDVFNGDGTYAFLEGLLISSVCFSDKRLVIITGLPPVPSKQKSSMLTKLKKLLSALPPDVCVIFDTIQSADEKSLSAHVATIGDLREFPLKVSEAEAAQFVIAQCSEKGKHITQDDAVLLSQTSAYDKHLKGYSLDILSIAIEKLVSYVGRRKNITKDDLLTTAFSSDEFNQWRLFDAFDSKNLDQCYSTVERVILEEGAIPALFSIFSMAAWRYKLLFYLKEDVAAGRSREEALSLALSLSKLAQSGASSHMKMEIEISESTSEPKMAYSDFMLKAALNGQYGRKPTIDIYSRKELYKITQIVQDVLRDMRDVVESSAMLMLDALILSICGKMDDNLFEAMRSLYARKIQYS